MSLHGDVTNKSLKGGQLTNEIVHNVRYIVESACENFAHAVFILDHRVSCQHVAAQPTFGTL